jgi:adenylate cyclase
MAAQSFKRKLAAILSADVKGYSRLMGEDEEGTIPPFKSRNNLTDILNSFI